VSLLVSVVWILLRLLVFQTFVFPLTYAVPLLLCVWTRDTLMLWTMAALFAVLHTAQQWWILPREALPEWADWATYAATLFNIAVAALVVHAIIVLRERLERSLDQMQAQSDELEQQNAELAEQTEELSTQSEQLVQQVEEISQQAEELSAQNEELETRGEEVRTLNSELAQRETLLETLFDAVRLAAAETDALKRVCLAAVEMIGAPVTAVVIYEAEDDALAIRGTAGIDSSAAAAQQQTSQRFVQLVIDQNRTACIDDLSLRPDLAILIVPGQPTFLAALGAPLTTRVGHAAGAIAFYSREKHEWTTRQFRIAEWIAAQAAHILETLRLQDALRRQAALLDLTPDAIFVRRLDGTITFWAAGAERLYGYTRDEAIGAKNHALLRTRYSVAQREVEEQLDRTGRWTGELIHTTKDGREIVVESRWLATRDARGSITELLESNMEITARKRAEEAVTRANAQLAAESRRKNEFLATLSHELRNPLAPIRYALEMLNSVDDKTATLRAKEVIERQLGHLVRLVDDLLDITRIASNKVRLRTELVTVASIVEHAVEATAPEIAQAKHCLTVSVPEQEIWLKGDPVRLSQVLTNLLTNAVRYTPAGGRITLTATALKDEAEITVSDTGIGLTPEDASKVFEMFAQVGEVRHGGLGIGLALVKGLVALHGGSIEVRSAGPGLGSEFTVRLPRVAAAAASPEQSAVIDDGPPQRVLIVDDNRDLAEMLKTFLEMHGHEVYVANDARSALETAARVRPHVGLFDIGLPGMSGYELAQRIREDPTLQTIYLVAVTGWGYEDDRERARRAGFDDHLTKPTDPDAIRALLSQASQSVRARRQSARL
jgi:two-component system CheB/CheR fusion protein